MKFKRTLGIIISAVMLFNSAGLVPVHAAENRLPAFPGAEGGGMYTLGARAADSFEIYHVTNLNDDGAGSFRDAVSQSNRIIVFDVAGTVMLKGELQIKVSNLTILGQTAPGEGVCIGGNSVLFRGCDNVILRYLRFRAGEYSREDALGGRDCTNVIIDHCSISWSTDENLSWYGNTNFTAQWNIISEPINSGGHGYGGLWGGTNASFHHNLLASCYSRNPRIATTQTVSSTPDDEALIDVRNNVIYNWGNYAGYGGENGVRVNFLNNYFKPAGNVAHAGIYFLYSGNKGSLTDSEGNGVKQSTTLYIDGNVYEGNDTFTSDNWNSVICESDGTYWIKRESIDSEGIVMHKNMPSELDVPENTGRNDQYIYDYPVTTQTAKEAYNDVLLYAGASYNRDITDEKVIKDVTNGTFTIGSVHGRGFIDSQEDVGGWCPLSEGERPIDTDMDGMPDEWEDKNGLDKTDHADAVKAAKSGYTNIEEYANSLAAAPVRKSVDRVELYLALIKFNTINDGEYPAETIEMLHKAANEAWQIFETSNSQSETDETAVWLNALFENALPDYAPILRNYINDLSGLDISKYTLESGAEFTKALEQAKEDIENAADNVTLKQDCDRLKSVYETLELSELPTLLYWIENGESELSSEGNAPLAILKNAVDKAKMLAESTDYTNETINTAVAEINSAIEIAYIYDNYLDILGNGLLGREHLSEQSQNDIEKVREEFMAARASENADKEIFETLSGRIDETIKNVTYTKNWKSVKFRENFESGKEYEFAEAAKENGNTYIKPVFGARVPEKNFKMDIPTDNVGDDFYVSVDFMHQNEGNMTLAYNLIFDDLDTVTVMTKGLSEIFVCRNRSGDSYASSYSQSVNVNAGEWNNLTAHYNKTSGVVEVYFNNALICRMFLPEGYSREISEINMDSYFEGLFQCYNRGNALDNVMLFEENAEGAFIYGDANADGSLTAADSAAILQKVLNGAYTMPIEDYTSDYLFFTDVDGSGTLTAADSAAVLQKVLNGAYKMPIENYSNIQK